MKFINFKALLERKKIILIALSVLFITAAVAFLLKHKPQTKPPVFSSFLKHSAGIIPAPITNTSITAVPVKENGKIPQKPAISKKQDNKLNDLFKLKPKKKSLPMAPAVSNFTPPAFPAPENQGYPNINNIPNAIRNIQSRLPGIAQVPNQQNFKVLGVSGQNALIQYQGGDLYLKAGEAFGNCFVIEIGRSSVKISCDKTARSYPVSFSESDNGNTNNNVNTNLNGIHPLLKAK